MVRNEQSSKALPGRESNPRAPDHRAATPLPQVVQKQCQLSPPVWLGLQDPRAGNKTEAGYPTSLLGSATELTLDGEDEDQCYVLLFSLKRLTVTGNLGNPSGV